MPPPLNPIIDDGLPETPVVLNKTTTRESWNRLRAWHAALPGSRIEHVLRGIFVLHVPSGGAKDLAA